MKLYFITSNKGKVLEAKTKLSELKIDVIQKDLGYPEIQTDSLEEVAIYGVEQIKKKFDQPFILEDAGLFIDELNGFPGVFSAYVYHTIGCEGILKLMDKSGNNQRKATFRSIYAFCKPDEKPLIFMGECKGIISDKQKGDKGFGYDPIFIPNNNQKTFAEMQISEKNIISHRGKALEKLCDYFKNTSIENLKSI